MTSPTDIARALLALHREDPTCLPPPPFDLCPGVVVWEPGLLLYGLTLRLPMEEPYRGAARCDLRDLLRARRAWLRSQAETPAAASDPEGSDPNQLSLL